MLSVSIFSLLDRGKIALPSKQVLILFGAFELCQQMTALIPSLR